MTAVVRDARPGEGRRIEEIRTAGWQAAYVGLLDADYLAERVVEDDRVARYEGWLAAPEPGQVTLVAEVAGEVRAFAMLGDSRDDDLPAAVELYALYVDPEHWFGGLGSRLLTAGFGRYDAPLQTLWTLAGNVPGRRFYERHGFAVDGAEKVLDLPGRPAEVRYRRPRLG